MAFHASLWVKVFLNADKLGNYFFDNDSKSNTIKDIKAVMHYLHSEVQLGEHCDLWLI